MALERKLRLAFRYARSDWNLCGKASLREELARKDSLQIFVPDIRDSFEKHAHPKKHKDYGLPSFLNCRGKLHAVSMEPCGRWTLCVSDAVIPFKGATDGKPAPIEETSERNITSGLDDQEILERLHRPLVERKAFMQFHFRRLNLNKLKKPSTARRRARTPALHR